YPHHASEAARVWGRAANPDRGTDAAGTDSIAANALLAIDKGDALPDTRLGLKPRRFSDSARPNGPPWHPKAVSRPILRLPRPQHVRGRGVVPVQACAALRAALPPDGNAPLDDHATAATRLAGERGVDRLHSLPGACSLESEDGQNRAPARSGDAHGE